MLAVIILAVWALAPAIIIVLVLWIGDRRAKRQTGLLDRIWMLPARTPAHERRRPRSEHLGVLWTSGRRRERSHRRHA